MITEHGTETRHSALTIAEVMAMVANGTHVVHHTSWRRGYVSRRPDVNGERGYVNDYDGRFGRGYVLHTPDGRATYYHHVTFIIEREG